MRSRRFHDRSAIRGSPIGLLHRLVERANQGTFTPSYAVPTANIAAEKLTRDRGRSNCEARTRKARGTPGQSHGRRVCQGFAQRGNLQISLTEAPV